MNVLIIKQCRNKSAFTIYAFSNSCNAMFCGEVLLHILHLNFWCAALEHLECKLDILYPSDL